MAEEELSAKELDDRAEHRYRALRIIENAPINRSELRNQDDVVVDLDGVMRIGYIVSVGRGFFSARITDYYGKTTVVGLPTEAFLNQDSELP